MAEWLEPIFRSGVGDTGSAVWVLFCFYHCPKETVVSGIFKSVTLYLKTINIALKS